MGTTVMKIEDAVVSYREDVALRGVSLKVESGEFVINHFKYWRRWGSHFYPFG